MRKTLLLLALMGSLNVMADSITVSKLRHIGPFEVKSPVLIDSVDNAQKKFSEDMLLNTPLSLAAVEDAAYSDIKSLSFGKGTLNVIGFGIYAPAYVKDAKLIIKGTKNYKVYADGTETSGDITMQPGYHTLKVKFIADSAAIDVTLSAEKATLYAGEKHPFGMTENLGTRVVSDVSLSPSGRWAIIDYRWYDEKNVQQAETMVKQYENSCGQTSTTTTL